MNGQIDLSSSIVEIKTKFVPKNQYKSYVLERRIYLSEEEKYEALSKGNEIRCLTEGCKGYLENRNNLYNIKKINKFLYKEDSIICKCGGSCKQEFVFVRNNLSSKVVSFKL